MDRRLDTEPYAGFTLKKKKWFELGPVCSKENAALAG